jgi:hypothetical protein
MRFHEKGAIYHDLFVVNALTVQSVFLPGRNDQFVIRVRDASAMGDSN